MEAFSLLRYWRNGGGNAAPAPTTVVGNVVPLTAKYTTTIANSLLRPSTSSSSSSVDGFEDEGPFFDLEFSVPDDEEEDETGTQNGNADDEVEEVEVEDAGVSVSPSNHLFFKDRLLPPESSSDYTHAGKQQRQLHHKQHHHHQFLAGSSLFKSATKFRVFTLKGSKKTKSIDPTLMVATAPSPKQTQQPGNTSSKFFTVKFKVEEVPIVSLFTRDGSSRSSGGGSKQNRDEVGSPAANMEGGKTSKEVVNKYLNKIKPLYVKVSRRSNGEKSKFSGVLGAVPENLAEPAETSMCHLQNRVRKRLGKSKSASSTVASVPSPPSTSGAISRRRDDSLLQQQDGIQSAIAHCKRSFNAPRDVLDSTPPTSKTDSYDETTTPSPVC